jgi:hypothetical protein
MMHYAVAWCIINIKKNDRRIFQKSFGGGKMAGI